MPSPRGSTTVASSTITMALGSKLVLIPNSHAPIAIISGTTSRETAVESSSKPMM